MVRQRIVPSRLLVARKVRVRPTRIGDEKKPSRSETDALKPKPYVRRLARERAVDEAVSGYPMEAGDARPVTPDFFDQVVHAVRELAPREFAGRCGRALHEIGEADAVREQRSVVLGAKDFGAQRFPRAMRENGARDARPEFVALAREIMPALDRIHRRVDSDEDDVKVFGEKIA